MIAYYDYELLKKKQFFCINIVKNFPEKPRTAVLNEAIANVKVNTSFEIIMIKISYYPSSHIS